MNRKERINDPQAALRTAFGGLRADIWTALPGIIDSYDVDAQTIVIQPGIKVPVRASDGSVTTAALPQLVDCPVQFPSGGNSTLTFPVAQGDECLVVFASRCIDAWWQSGGVQEQAELRMHSLCDGFALLGFRSKPRVLSSVSTTSAQLRSDDGSTYIDLNPTAQTVKIVAPGGFEIDAPTVTVNSPQSSFSGAVNVQGLFSFFGGMAGSIASGVAAVITGAVQFIGTITSNGHAIDSTHQHTDSGGSGLGGPPQ